MLMDALFITCMLIYLANTFITETGTGWAPGELLVVYTARAVWASLCALVWFALRRSHRKLWLVIFMLLGVLGMGMSQEDMMLVVVVIAFGRFGRRAGFGVAAFGLVAITLPIVLADEYANGWLRAYAIGQSLTMLATPVLLGLAMHWLQSSADRLTSANHEVRLATRELGARAEISHDLALAEERARTARELHDGLGHQLTIAGMSLDYVTRCHDSDAESARDELLQARELIDQALRATQAWSTAAPAASDIELGLPGVETIARSFRATGMVVHVNAPALTLGTGADLFITRFLQEGLTNALRHGQASSSCFDAELGPSGLTLSLRSVGPSPQALTEGFGLRSLRERAESLAGEFWARSTASGFEIGARLPCRADDLSASHAPATPAEIRGVEVVAR